MRNVPGWARGMARAGCSRRPSCSGSRPVGVGFGGGVACRSVPPATPGGMPSADRLSGMHVPGFTGLARLKLPPSMPLQFAGDVRDLVGFQVSAVARGRPAIGRSDVSRQWSEAFGGVRACKACCVQSRREPDAQARRERFPTSLARRAWAEGRSPGEPEAGTNHPQPHPTYRNASRQIAPGRTARYREPERPLGLDRRHPLPPQTCWRTAGCGGSRRSGIRVTGAGGSE